MAMTESRKMTQLAGIQPTADFAMLSGDVCYAGGIVAIDSSLELQLATDTLGLRVVGASEHQVDNSADGEELEAHRGIQLFENSATSTLTRACIGSPCYVEDAKTVAGKTTNYVAAGLVHDVTSDGVFVDQRPESLAAAVRQSPPVVIAKTDDYTVTAAQAFSRRCVFSASKAGGMTITLPSAVAGMKLGVKRLTASATYDVSIKAATGDTVLGSAAGKQVDNTVDAASGILWIEAVDNTNWIMMAYTPADSESWVINNA